MTRICFLSFLAIARLCPAADEPVFRQAESLDKLVRDTAGAAVQRFGEGGLTADKIAITAIDLADAKHPVRASFRGGAPIYPASVVKLFYLAAAHHQIEAGALASTPELERAARHDRRFLQ